jgi:uncharacterized LabA/DUF88 family protein
MKYAILMDAGFMKKKLGSQSNPLSANGVRLFLAALRSHAALKEMSLHRVYWYDAPPLNRRITRPLNGGILDLGATALAQANSQLHDDLCNTDFVSLRRGELVFRGWKLKKSPSNTAPGVNISAADLVPNIQQKGVDMRLGLDIAALTLKAHVGALVLVAGDSDFVPAMKFARREGAQLFLVTFGHSIRSDMREHCDVVLDVQLATPARGKTSPLGEVVGGNGIEPLTPAV